MHFAAMPQRTLYRWLAAGVFVGLNGVVLRAAHHWGGVPWRLSSMLASKPLQAALTLAWTLTALAVMVVALLVLGWLIASWCQNMVVLAADREREQASRAIMSRVGAVTSELVLLPVGRELAEYERFRTQLAAARRP